MFYIVIFLCLSILIYYVMFSLMVSFAYILIYGVDMLLCCRCLVLCRVLSLEMFEVGGLIRAVAISLEAWRILDLGVLWIPWVSILINFVFFSAFVRCWNPGFYLVGYIILFVVVVFCLLMFVFCFSYAMWLFWWIELAVWLMVYAICGFRVFVMDHV